MMNYLTFAGRSSYEFGVLISGEGTFAAPERNVTSQEIAGKNGNVIFDHGNFKNITVKYPAFIRENMPDKVRDFLNFMGSRTSYQRLEDTLHPYEFRMARFITNPAVTSNGYKNRGGKLTLEFDCKPQRFLKDGENVISFSANGTILNRTLYDAKPLLRIYGTGNGTVGIAGTTITLTGIDEYIDIDCELMDAFKGAINENNKVAFSEDFVTIPSGEHGVTFTGDVTGVDITPRWWII